ncbi:Panacea domain-containing protein [Bacillus sp. FJAT-52991]|uniref:Type II toxin-antitoxin system antitoxin SocA domain-containing protein n=1 Tax=Bacillus kandeliae TaxID=3129297 RepID=A0ABZ2N3B8_9BACI
MGMRELANHIIAVGKTHSLPVTNLQLQKVMFFALGMHLRRSDIDDLAIETYDIPFDKWQYGPVVESIYYRFNHLKDKDITKDFQGIYQDEYSGWDQMIAQLLQIDVFELVRVSHDMPSWADNEQDILSRNFVESYTLDEIHKDFTR